MDERERAEQVKRVSAGDADALQRLIVHYHPVLRRLIETKTEPTLRHHVDPDDVLQWAYINAFKTLSPNRDRKRADSPTRDRNQNRDRKRAAPPTRDRDLGAGGPLHYAVSKCPAYQHLSIIDAQLAVDRISKSRNRLRAPLES